MSGILPYKNIYPDLEKDVFIAPGAWVIGDVKIGERSSIWFNTVVRGDVNSIRIGEDTNVQDSSVLHVTTEKFPLNIGHRVTIGHRAIVHGCTVEDECLIGMGAVILDGAHIGKGSIIAAGSVVTPGCNIPAGSLVMGIPAAIKKTLTEEQQEELRKTALHYVKLAASYLRPQETKKVKGFLG